MDRYNPCYTELAQWQAVLEVPGCILSICNTTTVRERAAVRQQWGVTIHSWGKPMSVTSITAALLAALDLIVAPVSPPPTWPEDSGHPIWPLRVFLGSWPAFGTDASPWFPSVRVFQQTQRGDWTSVLTQVAEALKQ